MSRQEQDKPLPDRLQESLPDQYDPAFLQPEPDYGDSQSSEQAIASSPVLRDQHSSSLRFHNERPRESIASSLRFSQDLQDIRWKGPELGEDDSIFEHEPEDAGEETETEDPAPNEEGDTGDEDDARPSREELGAANYSTISKRADFILANAKKKLNLLEGNLGKARHSLNAPSPLPDLRTSSSLSSYAPLGGLDEDDRQGSVKISPRLKFTPSREARSINTARAGHSRMQSDPSPRATSFVKSSRSLDRIRDDETSDNPSLATMYEDTTRPSSLGSIAENGKAERRDSFVDDRDISGATSPPPKSTKDLRDQADELRSRIAFLQKRSREDRARGTPYSTKQNEETFLNQVRLLEQSLEDQEAVIAQLEKAERNAAQEKSARGEWQHVIDFNESRDDSDFSDEEDEDDYDGFYEGEVPDALQGEEPIDDSQPTTGPHEDRADAFDYEHFILHSVMGLDPESGERNSSASSSGSASTPRGQETPSVEDPASGQVVQSRNWEQFHHPNPSMASMTTAQSFETAAEGNDSASDSGSHNSGAPPEQLFERKTQRGRWPVPPSTRSSQSMPSNGLQRITSQEKDGATPTGSYFPKLSKDQGIQQDAPPRPISAAYEALVSPLNMTEKFRLDNSDESLVRSMVESLRRICLGLDGGPMATADSQGLRERLEVAKRVLEGEL